MHLSDLPPSDPPIGYGCILSIQTTIWGWAKTSHMLHYPTK